MASRAREFPFLPFIITFLSISANGNSVNSPPPPCATFDCGNGLTIGYPFHLQNHHQPPLCGYPDFAISCTNNQPILHISNQSFTVKNLNNSENSITVAYGAADAMLKCPAVAQGVTLGSDSLLNYTAIYNEIIRFFYNCTVYPPSVLDIKCLQRGAKRSYAFVDGSVPEFDWIRNCESMATVPVIRNDVHDPINALKLGFKLTWKSVDRSCEVCEESGGFCGYSSSKSVDRNFVCFCSDGKHSSLSCHGQGEVSETSQPNYVAIGVVIFGGLLAIITVFVLFVNKKKNGVEKSGFSQIPTIYGK